MLSCAQKHEIPDEIGVHTPQRDASFVVKETYRQFTVIYDSDRDSLEYDTMVHRITPRLESQGGILFVFTISRAQSWRMNTKTIFSVGFVPDRLKKEDSLIN